VAGIKSTGLVMENKKQEKTSFLLSAEIETYVDIG
jgi:hypothetical protein